MPEVSSHSLPEPLAKDVGFLLARAAAGAVRDLNRALAPHGLRAKHFALLQLLSTGQPMAQRSLGPVLGLDASNVVPLVDELAASGLLQRQTDPEDRRARRVRITADGRRVLRAALPLAAGVQAHLLEELTPAERDAVLAALGTMVTRLL